MDIVNNPLLLRKVLAYDSFVGADLSLYERMLIHQHIGQNTTLTTKLVSKIKRIAKRVAQEHWKAPEFRYVEDTETTKILLQVYDTEAARWKTFTPLKKE